MNTAEAEIVWALDRMAQERFNLEATRQGYEAALKAQEADLKAKFAERMAPVAERIEQLDAEIWQLVQDNRSSLIKPGKKSFAIAAATFQFRELKAKIVPTNVDGIMAVARRHGMVRDIADPPTRKWKFNKQRFLGWLDAHAHLRHWFDKFLEETDSGESLTVKPNTGHAVFHDPNRLTPIPFIINKS